MAAIDIARIMNEKLKGHCPITFDQLQSYVLKKIGVKPSTRHPRASVKDIDLNAKPRLPRDMAVPKDLAQKIINLFGQGKGYHQIARILKDDPMYDFEITASRMQSCIQYHLMKGHKPRLPAGELPDDMQSEITRRFAGGQGYFMISKAMNEHGNYPYEIMPSRVQWYLKKQGLLPS